MGWSTAVLVRLAAAALTGVPAAPAADATREAWWLRAGWWMKSSRGGDDDRLRSLVFSLVDPRAVLPLLDLAALRRGI